MKLEGLGRTLRCQNNVAEKAHAAVEDKSAESGNLVGGVSEFSMCSMTPSLYSMCRHVHSYMYVTSGSEIVKDAALVFSHKQIRDTGAKEEHGEFVLGLPGAQN